MKKKIENTINFYHGLNDNCKTYIGFEELENSWDKEFITLVNKLYYAKETYNNVQVRIKSLDKFYNDGQTYNDFMFNIFRNIGAGDDKKGKVKFFKELDLLANKIEKEIYKYFEVDRGTLKKCIVLVGFFRTYKGFLFESMIKSVLETNNLFKIEQSHELDRDYKIDLLISLHDEKYKDIKLGLQLKSFSYLAVSNYYDSKKYANKGHESAIDNGICKDILFILHDNDLDIVKEKHMNLFNRNITGSCLFDRDITQKKYDLINPCEDNYLELEIGENIEIELIDKLLFKILLEYNRSIKSSSYVRMVRNCHDITDEEIEEFKKEQKKAFIKFAL